MIVKIWPIKGDYASQPGKVGGVEGLKNALDYICDDEKVMVKQDDLRSMNIMQDDGRSGPEYTETNTTRVIRYMANEDKIEGKYISGYLCNPENAVTEFDMARTLTLARAGEEREKETGAVAFHIVQSFPEGLDISDEEVHQCGLELCEKINAHQAVICSHVHPAVDEQSGEVHGKCKHNHIMINAYIHPDKIDPMYPNRLKYNDCKETYALLREWNDEIAIEHGLPIIRNPDEERTYSWKEVDATNKGLSWKERMRMDIEAARRVSSNWNEFLAVMKKAGYIINEGAHVTYTAPDGSRKARGGTLGKEYTKESLELYWSLRRYTQQAVEESIRDNASSPLLTLAENSPGQIHVGIPIGIQGKENRTLYYMPIDKVKADRDALETYFNAEEIYDVFNPDHQAVTTATGAEIIRCIEQLRQERDALTPETPEEEYEEERKKNRYYTNPNFYNSRTKRPYRTSLYDHTGRRRTTLELLFILAITILKKEDGLWQPTSAPKGREKEVLYADTNWKIQNMMDSMYLAQTENIESVAQLEQRLDAAGASYSRTKSALRKTLRAKEKMDTLYEAVQEYQKTKELAERLHGLPDGRDKVELQEKHKDVIQRYKNAKAVMYRYQVTEEAQVEDFLLRYDRIQDDIIDLESRFDEAKEEYRKLKKLHYNASLAENAQYCYGVEYTHERANDPQELAEREENAAEVLQQRQQEAEEAKAREEDRKRQS